jgi:transporter family-2 protein
MQAGYIPLLYWAARCRRAGRQMNAQLFQALGNKWLANAISFALILAFFACVFAMFPQPLPTSEGLSKMPWWAPLGGLVGAVQVYAGLTLVHKVGGITLIAKH